MTYLWGFSHRLLTTETRVQTQANSCGIFDVALGQLISEYFVLLPSFVIALVFLTLLSSSSSSSGHVPIGLFEDIVHPALGIYYVVLRAFTSNNAESQET